MKAVLWLLLEANVDDGFTDFSTTVLHYAWIIASFSCFRRRVNSDFHDFPNTFRSMFSFSEFQVFFEGRCSYLYVRWLWPHLSTIDLWCSDAKWHWMDKAAMDYNDVHAARSDFHLFWLQHHPSWWDCRSRKSQTGLSEISLGYFGEPYEWDLHQSQKTAHENLTCYRIISAIMIFSIFVESHQYRYCYSGLYDGLCYSPKANSLLSLNFCF